SDTRERGTGRSGKGGPYGRTGGPARRRQMARGAVERGAVLEEAGRSGQLVRASGVAPDRQPQPLRGGATGRHGLRARPRARVHRDSGADEGGGTGQTGRGGGDVPAGGAG